MVNIPIDLWIREAKHVGFVVKKVIEVADDVEGDTPGAIIGLNIWESIIKNMEEVKEERDRKGVIEVI